MGMETVKDTEEEEREKSERRKLETDRHKEEE